MTPAFQCQLLADAVLILHVAIVCFIVGGLVMIISGNLLRWKWVNSLRFRLAHLLAILTVVAEAWTGLACPLTTLESWLRSQTGKSAYAGGFIEHWLQQFLYYAAPPWVFTLSYTLFGLLIAITWWYFPPVLNKKTQQKKHLKIT